MPTTLCSERFSCHLYTPESGGEVLGHIELDWEADDGTTISSALDFAKRLLERFQSANLTEIMLAGYTGTPSEIAEQAGLGRAYPGHRLCVKFHIGTSLSQEAASQVLNRAGFLERQPGQ